MRHGGRWAVESANATGGSCTQSMYRVPSGLDVLVKLLVGIQTPLYSTRGRRPR